MGTADSRLLNAAKLGNTVEVEQALRDGANVNACDVVRVQKFSRKLSFFIFIQLTKESAMHRAAEGGFVNVIDILVKAGGDLNFPNTFGCTPLHLAVQADSVPGCQALMDRGALIEAKDIVSFALS
jgi:ankyrin repeat protein